MQESQSGHKRVQLFRLWDGMVKGVLSLMSTKYTSHTIRGERARRMEGEERSALKEIDRISILMVEHLTLTCRRPEVGELGPGAAMDPLSD